MLISKTSLNERENELIESNNQQEKLIDIMSEKIKRLEVRVLDLERESKKRKFSEY